MQTSGSNNYSASVKYSLASTSSHTSAYSFTEGMTLQESFEVGPPLVASGGAKLEFNFSATQVRPHKTLL